MRVVTGIAMKDECILQYTITGAGRQAIVRETGRDSALVLSTINSHNGPITQAWDSSYARAIPMYNRSLPVARCRYIVYYGYRTYRSEFICRPCRYRVGDQREMSQTHPVR